MIYTARQLQDLHKANGHVTLPSDARLSPLAIDWIRKRKLEVQYGDAPRENKQDEPTSTGDAMLWWCDGPCGASKAAITQQARMSNLREIDISGDASQLANVVKQIATEVKSSRAGGAILLVQHGAAAMVFTNRCPSLRAVLGTCLDSVDQAIRRVAANVLVIEHPHKTLMEVRNMLGRFCAATGAGSRELSSDIRRQLEDLASCG